ncbi:MAG: hypothetical protein JJ975_10290 [Bacteroidia bacterium]|nr:hypothetical protein [Bacteroidia bacterium]
MHRLNKIYWGILFGLIVPAIVMFVAYRKGNIPLEWANKADWKMNMKILNPFLRLSLIPNMLFFIPYGKWPRNQLLKGLLISTFLYGIVIVVIYFL